MTTTIRPLQDRVVLRRSEPDNVSKGGIIIAATAQEKSLRCEVLAVGPGKVNDKGERVPVDVKQGDVVLIGSKYAGQEIDIESERYLLVRADEIAGVLD